MVREARIDDLGAITEIYNQAIDAQFQTCFTEPYSPEMKQDWFYEHDGTGYPLLVYELDGAVAGFLSVSPYRQGRHALRFAVEISYFVHIAHHKKGIGSALLGKAISQCREIGYKTALAILLVPNKASIALLEKFGFAQWGYMPDIAEFDGVVCGQLYYGLKL